MHVKTSNLSQKGRAFRHVAVVLDLAHSVARQYFRGIVRYSRLHGPWVILANLQPRFDSLPATEMACDGALGMFYDEQRIDRLMLRGTPLVTMSAALEHLHLPLVEPDQTAGGRMAAAHLLDRGFNHLAYVGISQGAIGARRNGFSGECLSAGKAYSEFRTHAGDVDWTTAPGELDDWLKSLARPVGILGGTEMDAWTIVGKCLDLGIEVPERVAVVSVGNDDLVCEACDVPLTSVAFPGEKVGYEGAAMLDRLMRGELLPASVVRIPPIGVVTRQSTDVLAIDDDDVARAVRVVRERACGGLTVPELLREVPVDRRWLERQFRARLRRTIMDEIYRVRIHQAKMMLSGSEIKIADIAEKCGFSQMKSFGAIFRQITGSTPASFRKSFRSHALPLRMMDQRDDGKH